ncbi:MAG: hypothetical protein JW797_18935 [Bradymonadales bacterium]|nr:hypothetical protein [Bradymonadales bacterium]
MPSALRLIFLILLFPLQPSLFLGCASVAPPAIPDPDPPALLCRPLAGTERGLLIQVAQRTALPPLAVVALFRDGSQLAAFEVTEMGDPPQPVILGDPALVPDRIYRYTCGAWLDTRSLSRMELTVTGGSPPPRPGRPLLTPQPEGVLVGWQNAEEGLYTVVSRRSVLSDSEPVVISPALGVSSWLDTTVESGEVYAYSLHQARLVDQVMWFGESGSEGYVEVGTGD